MLYRFICCILCFVVVLCCAGCCSTKGTAIIDVGNFNVKKQFVPSQGDKLAMQKLSQALKNDNQGTLFYVTWKTKDSSGLTVAHQIEYTKSLPALDYLSWEEKDYGVTKKIVFDGVTEQMIHAVAATGTVDDLTKQGATKREVKD
jgi:hypothetical protein